MNMSVDTRAATAVQRPQETRSVETKSAPVEGEKNTGKGFDFDTKSQPEKGSIEHQANSYGSLTKKELESRIDKKEAKVEEADQRLQNTGTALEEAAKEGNEAFAAAGESIEVANQKIKRFDTANQNFTEQEDRLATLMAAREAKANGTEMTKEAKFASEDDTTGYADGFAQLTLEELDSRIAQKEQRLEKAEANVTNKANEAITADEEKNAALAKLETADENYQMAAERFEHASVDHNKQHTRLDVLEHALTEKETPPVGA